MMHSPRDQFFAGSAFPGDQHGRSRRRHLPDQRKYLLHGGASSYQVHQHPLVRQLPLQTLGLFGQPALGGGALQQNFQRTGLDGLFQKPKRPQIVHGLDSGLDVSKSRQHNSRRQGILRSQTLQ